MFHIKERVKIGRENLLYKILIWVVYCFFGGGKLILGLNEIKKKLAMSDIGQLFLRYIFVRWNKNRNFVVNKCFML